VTQTSGAAPLDALSLIGRLRRTFALGLTYLWILSGCIAVLQLTVPFFIIQVYDRVLNSQSLDTLRMLVVLCAGALVMYGLLEFIRSVTFLALANNLVRRLNLPTIESALRRSLERDTTDGAQALRDLHELLGFVTGNAISAPLEAAWSPVFLLVMFALHPVYGLIGVVALLILIGLSVLSDLLSRQIMREANEANIENI
jgi:ATP-binding cassette subfamily C protein